jgi:hypothetical protein
MRKLRYDHCRIEKWRKSPRTKVSDGYLTYSDPVAHDIDIFPETFTKNRAISALFFLSDKGSMSVNLKVFPG